MFGYINSAGLYLVELKQIKVIHYECRNNKHKAYKTVTFDEQSQYIYAKKDKSNASRFIDVFHNTCYYVYDGVSQIEEGDLVVYQSAPYEGEHHFVPEQVLINELQVLNEKARENNIDKGRQLIHIL